jgi:hypothetical protein
MAELLLTPVWITVVRRVLGVPLNSLRRAFYVPGGVAAASGLLAWSFAVVAEQAGLWLQLGIGLLGAVTGFSVAILSVIRFLDHGLTQDALKAARARFIKRGNTKPQELLS